MTNTHTTRSTDTYFAAAATGRHNHSAHKTLAAAQRAASKMGAGRSGRVLGPFASLAEARRADISESHPIVWTA